MSEAREHCEEILTEIKRWVTDSFNEQFLYEKSLEKVGAFTSGREFHIGELLSSLDTLSRWYAAKGIIELFDGRPTNYLCDSFWFSFFYNRIMRHSFERAKGQKMRRFMGAALGLKHLQQPRPRIGFNDQGLLLAKAFALGLVDEGEAIGRDSLIGLEDGRFYGLHANKLTPFVVSVFARWKNIALPPVEFPFAVQDGYQELLQKLLEGPEEIRTAIAKASDFHLSRSKDHTDDETYEFAHPVDAIYPVEILFVFRVRQLLGLHNPEVDHPLLNSPLGKLPDTKCSLRAELTPLLERIEKGFAADYGLL